MLKILKPFALLLIFAGLAGAVDISGSLSGTLGPGVYRVIADISVANAASLTIAPGTDISFNQNTAFLIHGLLTAAGTVSDSIIFDLHSSATAWKGIYFYGDSDDNSLMQFCRISHAAPDTGRGGAVAVWNADPDFFNCVFSANSTPMWGGGIFTIGSNSTLTNCEFIDNLADYGGGFYCREGSNNTLTNCLIEGNHASSYGGGLRVYQNAAGVFTNCTVAHNTCNNYDRSAFQFFNASGTFNNSIIWGNGDQTGYHTTYSVTNGTVTFNYSCVESTVPLTGTNFTEEPLFVNPDDDFHLLPGSRCIDAGNPASGYANEPLPNGGRINMGYYGNTAEATPSQVTLSIPRDIYVMMGVPVELVSGDPIDNFADDVAYAAPGWPWWRVSRWNIPNATYIRYQEPDFPLDLGLDPPPFIPGLGYWFVQNVVDGCVLDIIETQIDSGALLQFLPYEVDLEPPANGHHGMNMIANPYPYTYDWRQSFIHKTGGATVTIEAAADSGWVSGYAYTWDHFGCQYAPVEYQLDKSGGDINWWQGFLVEQLTDEVDLKVVFTPRRLWVNPPTMLDDDEEWALNLSAACGLYKDEFNRLGAAPASSDSYDKMDALEYTPYSDSFVQLFFPHPEWNMLIDNFTYDYRSPDFTQPKVWDFSIGAFNLAGQQVTLSWNNIAQIPSEYSFRLEDLTNGQTIENLRSVSNYSFTAVSSADLVNFTITVTYTPSGVYEPEIHLAHSFGLVSAYPNPFNNQMSVTFNLDQSGFVSLKVYDLLGREAAVLVNDMLSPGEHSAALHGQNLAAGLYFLRLESASGSDVRKVILLK